MLLKNGSTAEYADKAANKVLINAVNAQNHIRYAIDYYEVICVMLVLILLIVALFPYFNRTKLIINKHQPSPF